MLGAILANPKIRAGVGLSVNPIQPDRPWTPDSHIFVILLFGLLRSMIPFIMDTLWYLHLQGNMFTRLITLDKAWNEH